ncbi:hypothetical protein THAOC_13882 [Thalassiosira oceanica]|uniref:MORN repeat-containing protein 5 n=1 Tax=Thalassiosira oceanica TaxID=159749 RepID=K0SIY5_THAOC|nr:hypothetical protein THAOC_13882 [Thalassiosira oceanica]|eukprot:EJK65275.1 hypothetical protein THAOC_13882 [Thalassiosira oceanica]
MAFIYTGQIVGGKLHGTGRKEKGSQLEEGVFVDDFYMKAGEGKFSFADGEVHDGVFVDGRLNGHGKVTAAATFLEEGNIDGTFVDGYIDAGMAENVKCDDCDIYTGKALPTKCLGPTVVDPIITNVVYNISVRLPCGTAAQLLCSA